MLRPVRESGFVSTNDLVTSLLKLDREEERSGDVDPLDLDTAGVQPARKNLVRPETKAGGIYPAIQKIVVVLTELFARRQ